VDQELAIVTGAGSGIGRACALALGKRGFAVAAIDLDEKSAGESAAQIPGARAYVGDVSVSSQVDAAVGAAVADLGPLGVLVNNAGILDGYFNVEELDEAVWRAWVEKGKARDRDSRRRWRMIASSACAGLVLIAGTYLFLMSN